MNNVHDFLVGLAVVCGTLTLVIVVVALLFPSRGGSDQ
jgi:hypothetical protein